MKKIIAASLLSAFAMTTAQAAPNNVGCGFGSMIFAGKNSIPEQVLAATTNGTFGNQTFGISSGTAGCARDGVVQKYAAADAFMGANMEKVARDMSTGQGEAIETLATLMGIADEHKASFYAVSKNNFDKIFSSENVTSEQALSSLNEVMASDKVLAQYTV